MVVGYGGDNDETVPVICCRYSWLHCNNSGLRAQGPGTRLARRGTVLYMTWHGMALQQRNQLLNERLLASPGWWRAAQLIPLHVPP